jgi:hypothetical protein
MPFWYVHVEASQRRIQKDMERLVRAWKARRESPKRRLRKKKLDEYLQVWDAREGWTGCRYDERQSLKFPVIARQRNKKVSTVFEQYREAFQLITGHPFSYELWYRLIAPFHVSQLLRKGDDYLTRPVRRRLQPNSRRPVPESVLVAPNQKDGRRPDFFAANNDEPTANGPSDFFLEVMTAIRTGASDQQICEMFPHLERPTTDRIRALRERIAELKEFD